MKIFNKQLIPIYFSQLVNIFCPFVIIYIITSRFGLDEYGYIAYFLSYSVIAQLFVIYGFDHLLTVRLQDFSSLNERSLIISSSIISRFFLALFICLASLILDVFFDGIYFLSSLVGMALIFNGYYFFAYTNTIWKHSILTSMGRLFSAIIVYLFYIEEGDFYIVLVANVLGVSLVSIFVIYDLIRSGHKININRESVKESFSLIRRGGYIFFAQGAGTIVANLYVIMIGWFFGSYWTGVFSLAEKITRAVALMTSPFLNYIFPKLSILFREDSVAANKFISKLIIIGSSSLIFLYLFIIIIFNIDHYYFGYCVNDCIDVYETIKLYYITVVIGFLNNIFGVQYLVSNKMDKEYSLIVIIGLAMSILLAFFSGMISYNLYIFSLVFSSCLIFVLLLRCSILRGFKFYLKRGL